MLAQVETNWRDDLVSLDSVYDVFKLLKRTTEEFEFLKFSVVEVPWEDHSLSTVMILNNWDPEFIQAYDELELAKNSPIFLHVRKSVCPLLFDVEEIQKVRPTSQRQKAMDTFKSFKKTKGLIIPVSVASGLKGAITFTGSDISIQPDRIDELHARCMYIFEKLMQVRETDKSRLPLLSDRELECLKWSAIGKTSGEVATIVSVTETTVNHHLAAACKKLGASNKVHAVAKALRLRLID